jgi:hypothetical protein
MAGHRRLDTRYSIEFPAQLTYARRAHSLVTHDVSEGGVFLRTESPPPLMQLVQVHLVLPIGGRALSAYGMTVHVVDKDNAHGRMPGIGVQFYALDKTTRETWEAFTRHVASAYPESHDQTPLRMVRGATPEPLSRRFQHHKAVLPLLPATLDELEEILTRDFPTGRLFVPTDLVLPTGSVVVVHVTHPDDKSPFLLQAKVASRPATPPGLVVELLGNDGRLQLEFLSFVRRSIVFDDALVTPDPPDAT